MKAIVTGHSKGLGGALAEALLERQISVLGLARSLSEPLAARFSGLLEQVQLDLSDTGALARWLAGGALARFMGEDESIVLINNAGMVEPVGGLADQDATMVAQAVALNVGTPLMLAAAVVGARAGKACRIVHISSGAGRSAYAGWSVYCATKAALDHHARAVALDASPGVRICSLAPGIIDTGMQAQIRATPAARFALRERFIDLHRDGALTAPATSAALLLDYIFDSRFGQSPVDDLRSA
jgi:hypothetical protein